MVDGMLICVHEQAAKRTRNIHFDNASRMCEKNRTRLLSGCTDLPEKRSICLCNEAKVGCVISKNEKLP